jgi:methionyl-tRNA formyltransferase
MKNVIVFFNGLRGLAVLETICKSQHEVIAVVTQTNISDEISKNIKKYHLNHLCLENINSVEALEQLKNYDPELFVVAGYSTILKQVVFNIPLLGTINLHAGRLPEYRGGSPLNWQLMQGEAEAGISVILMDQGIDTGCVLADDSFSVNENDTIADLHQKANRLFPSLVMKAINKLEVHDTSYSIQDESKAQYWHQRNDADGELDFEGMTVLEVSRMIRALTEPYPGAWAKYEGKVVRLFSAEIPKIIIKGVPGRICYIQGQGPYVICKDCAILVNKYEIENEISEKLRHGKRFTS